MNVKINTAWVLNNYTLLLVFYLAVFLWVAFVWLDSFSGMSGFFSHPNETMNENHMDHGCASHC